MTMRKYLFPLGLVFIALCYFTSCSDDDAMMPDMDEIECVEDLTFNDDIQMIINTNCAYSGCHVAGTGLPDYSSYSEVAAQVETGGFEDRVLVRQNMPPSNASGPTELSDGDLNTLRCWIDQGYPE